MAEADVQAVITARDEASATIKSVTSSMGGLVGQFALGNIVANIATKAWDDFKGTLTDAYNASNTIQNSMAQITQILKDNHDASGQSAESIENWATKLNSTTPISKEAALAGAQTLLTFTNLGKDVFPQASQAVADMAEHLAKGGVVTTDNMSSAAQRLGVALTDPATGFTRLKLAGITFTPAQEAAIKVMEKTNGVGAAQQLMLDDLATKLGGTASAAGKTFTGHMTTVRDILVNIIEVKVIDKIKQGFEDFANFLSSHQTIFYALIGVIGGLGIALGTSLVIALGSAVLGFLLLDGAALPWIGLAALIGAAIGGMAYIIIKNWKDIHKELLPLINIFKQDLWPIIQRIAQIVENQFKVAWDDIKKSLDELWKTLSPYKSELEDLAKVIGIILLTPLLIAIAGFVLFTTVITAVVTYGARLIGWFFEAGAAIINFEVGFVRMIAHIISSIVGDGAKIISWFINLPGAIINAIGDATKWLYKIGKDMITGIINGVDDAVHGIGDAIGKVAKDVGGAVKGALHTIHVPGFAQGGIIPATPGGQLVLVGEGGQDEAIVPLPNGSKQLPFNSPQSTNNTTINIIVQAQAFMGSQVEARKFASDILNALQQVATSKNTTVANMIGS